jgi:hypothetical protein
MTSPGGGLGAEPGPMPTSRYRLKIIWNPILSYLPCEGTQNVYPDHITI